MRSGIVYKRWERSGPRFRNTTCPAAQTMTSRTGGTRSSRRRMLHEAASGRPLKTKCEHCFLVAPHAHSPAINSAGLTGADFGPVEKRKKTSKLPKPSPESPSPPAPGRELFDSPLGVGTDGEEVHTPAPSRSQLADAVEVQLVTAEDVHDVLLRARYRQRASTSRLSCLRATTPQGLSLHSAAR